MKCRTPLTIKQKNGINTIVSCGRCIACRVNATEEWTTRILHEVKDNEENCFITLTYSEEFLPTDRGLHKEHLQLFFKRLRKNIPDVRYFAVGEYGDKYQRPHYHAIIFGLSKYSEQLVSQAWSQPIEWEGIIPVDWKQIGRISSSEVTEGRARYCAQYTQKKLFGFGGEWYGKREKEFVLVSRRPGIGGHFADRYLDLWYEHDFIVVDGKQKPIPKYYISRLTEEQRNERSKRSRISGYVKLLGRKEEIKEEQDEGLLQEQEFFARKNLKRKEDKIL